MRHNMFYGLQLLWVWAALFYSSPFIKPRRRRRDIDLDCFVRSCYSDIVTSSGSINYHSYCTEHTTKIGVFHTLPNGKLTSGSSFDCCVYKKTQVLLAIHNYGTMQHTQTLLNTQHSNTHSHTHSHTHLHTCIHIQVSWKGHSMSF